MPKLRHDFRVLALIAMVVGAVAYASYLLVHHQSIRRVAIPVATKTTWPAPVRAQVNALHIRERWAVEVLTFYEGSVADPADKSIYVLRGGGVQKINGEGKTEWKTPLKGYAPSPCVLKLRASNTLAIEDEFGYTAFTFDTKTGSKTGTFASSDRSPNSHGVKTILDLPHGWCGTDIYVLGAKGKRHEYLMTRYLPNGLVCFDRFGKPRWKMPGAYSECGIAVADDDSVTYVNISATEDWWNQPAQLVQMSSEGEAKWAHQVIPVGYGITPLIDSAGGVYFLADGETQSILYRVEPGGTPGWSIDFTGHSPIGDPALSPDGQACSLIIPSEDNSFVLEVIDSNGSVIGKGPIPGAGHLCYASADRIYLCIEGKSWKQSDRVIAYDLFMDHSMGDLSLR